MKNWEKFEKDCTDYLNQKFGQYAVFRHQGGADSTVADILVQAENGENFYIDAKNCPAQCGQFVLLPDLKSNTFKYSPKNATPFNPYAESIMNYMNSNFHTFLQAGTAGLDIQIENSRQVFSGWVIDTYQSKGVAFFISNQFTLVPIQQFSDYFDVTAKYRIKRSGSSQVGKSRISAVLKHIFAQDFGVADFRIDEGKLFISSPHDLHDRRFELQGKEYLFSRRGCEYELRRLSNTYNANVIFSIQLRSTVGLSDADFIRFLT